MDFLFDWFMKQINNNDIFIGLTSASLIGSFTYILRGLPKVIIGFLKHQFSSSMTITNDDPIFNIINNWIYSVSSNRTLRNLKISTHDGFTKEKSGEFISMSPGTGNHIILYKYKPLLINKTVENENSTIGFKETINIRCLGRSRKIHFDIIHDALSKSENNMYVKVFMFIDSWWDFIGYKQRRDINTVVLKRGQKERLLNDVNRFLESKEWYKEKGIPYHRGYMLYGPPGTGKTSIIVAIASHFYLPIYIVNINSIKNDNDLMNALNKPPKRSIVVIEDIDGCSSSMKRFFDDNKNGDDSFNTDANSNERKTGVTISGLLNALDGIGTTDGRIIFMTTNNIDKIDSALIRPGRVDFLEEIGYVDKDQLNDILTLLYGQCDKVKKNSSYILDSGITVSEIQKDFILSIGNEMI